MRLTFILAFLLVSLQACGGAAPQQVKSKAPEPVTSNPQNPGGSNAAGQTTSKRLLELARTAKARGESLIRTQEVPERDTKSNLEDVLRSHSVLLATYVSGGRAMVVGDAIRTPHEFRVDRWVSQRVPSSEQCDELPTPITSHSPGSVILDISAGTITVDGVSIIEQTESSIVFELRQQYLLFADACPESRIALTHSDNSVFIVKLDGTVSTPSYNQPIVPFVNQVIELGNIGKIEAHIRAAARR